MEQERSGTATTTARGRGGGAVEYGRPDAIEDSSNRFFIHPIAARLVDVAIAWRISANVISFLGLGCGLLAAVLYWFLPQPLFVLGGFAAMICWHILDGVDGKVARATGTASAFGRIVDGVCDHLVFIAIYCSLAFHMMATGSAASVWGLVVAAGLSHALQAAGYEERRQKYQRRRAGLNRDSVQSGLLLVHGHRSFLASLYDSSQKLLAGPDRGLDDALARLRSMPGQQQLAAIIVDRTVPMVRAWSLLNANNRTLLITFFALVGKPVLYFLFELVILNFVMLVLMLAESHQEKSLAKQAAVDHGREAGHGEP